MDIFQATGNFKKPENFLKSLLNSLFPARNTGICA